jgi:hypothetical protein
MADEAGPYWYLVKQLFEAVSIETPAAFLASSAVVPRPALLLSAAHFYLSEVHDGGFLLFFWNSTGILASEAVEGFAAIAMMELSALVVTTAGLLGDPYPRDEDERWDALLERRAEVPKSWRQSSNGLQTSTWVLPRQPSRWEWTSGKALGSLRGLRMADFSRQPQRKRRMCGYFQERAVCIRGFIDGETAELDNSADNVPIVARIF